MKKAILIVAVLLASLASNAQNTDHHTPRNEKLEYSFLWGLFKSKDYIKNNPAMFELGTLEFSTSLSESAIDSTKYEQKSILWGAIQWTAKKTISKNQW